MKRLLVCLAAVVLLAGCMPTPEQPAVVQKDMEQFLQRAQYAGADTAAGQLAAPEHVQEALRDEKAHVTVQVDADVQADCPADVPIYRVQPALVTQEMVGRAVAALFDGSPIYTAESAAADTREDVLDWLGKLHKRKAELEAQGMQSERGEAFEPTGEGNVAMQGMNALAQVEDGIDRLEEYSKKVPEKRTLIPSGTELIQMDGYSCLHIAQESARGGIRSLFIRDDNNGNLSSIDFASRGDNVLGTGIYYLYDEAKDGAMEDYEEAMRTIPGPRCTAEEAARAAEALAGELGLDAFAVDLVRPVIGGASAFRGDSVRLGNMIRGYEVVMARRAADMPVVYCGQTFATPENAETWAYETFRCIVDDGGIVEASLQGPSTVVEAAVDRCALKSFAEIWGVFRKMILSSNADVDGGAQELQVRAVRFGYATVVEQNTPGAMLVPAWFFCGTRKMWYGGAGNAAASYRPEEALLVVNAVDGSIIDIQEGY